MFGSRVHIRNYVCCVKRLGDILRLPMRLYHSEVTVEAGGYVFLSVGDVCCVASLVEDAQGKYCTSALLRYVPMADLCYFLVTGMRVDPVG